LPSPGDTIYCLRPSIRSSRAQDASHERPGGVHPVPHRTQKAWRQRDLPGSWMTLSRICPALRPRSGRCARPLRHLGAAPALVTTKAPTVSSFEAQSHGFYGRCLRFALGSPLTRKARFWLLADSTRWDWLPTGSLQKVSATSSLPPSPGSSWRDTKHVSRVARWRPRSLLVPDCRPNQRRGSPWEVPQLRGRIGAGQSACRCPI
jgi:hypothetical protein